MKNVVITLLVSALLLLSYSTFADDELSSEMRIYFCSRDLEDLASSAVSSDKTGPVAGSFHASPDINDTDHLPTRHCFVLLAEEIGNGPDVLCNSVLGSSLYGGTKVDVRYDPKTGVCKSPTNILMPIDSAGYGPVAGSWKNARVTNEKWLSNSEALTMLPVSCVPIMNETDVKDGDVEHKRMILSDEWEDLKERMVKISKKVKGGYTVESHNCCAVAYEGIRENPKFRSSAVDKRSFNLLGVGISFNKKDDSNVKGYVGGVLDSSIRSMSGVIRVIVNKVFYSDEGRDKNKKTSSSDDL